MAFLFYKNIYSIALNYPITIYDISICFILSLGSLHYKSQVVLNCNMYTKEPFCIRCKGSIVKTGNTEVSRIVLLIYK